MTTIPELRTRHDDEEREVVRAALEASGWNVTQAAFALQVSETGLRKTIPRLGLADEYAERSPGRGRPRKVTGSA